MSTISKNSEFLSINVYDILGINNGINATDDEIKKAYRRQSLLVHPDKNPDDPKASEKFDMLKKVYEYITETGNKFIYDEHKKQLLMEKQNYEQRMLQGGLQVRSLEEREEKHTLSTQNIVAQNNAKIKAYNKTRDWLMNMIKDVEKSERSTSNAFKHNWEDNNYLVFVKNTSDEDLIDGKKVKSVLEATCGDIKQVISHITLPYVLIEFHKSSSAIKAVNLRTTSSFTLKASVISDRRRMAIAIGHITSASEHKTHMELPQELYYDDQIENIVFERPITFNHEEVLRLLNKPTDRENIPENERHMIDKIKLTIQDINNKPTNL